MKSSFILCRAILLSFLASPVLSFSGVDAFFRTSPYVAAAMVHGMKGICADFVAQKHQWKQERENGEDFGMAMSSNNGLVAASQVVKEKIDLKRTAVSLIYGALYQGVVLEHSYNHIYPQMFGSGADFLSVTLKVTFNMLIQSPLLTLPAAYISKSFVFGYSVREAFRKYLDDLLHHKLLLKYYSLWVPGMSFAFGVVPDHLRITFCAMLSFFWMIILSVISNKKEEAEECLLIDGATCKLNE